VKDISTKKKQFDFSSAAAAHLITPISSLLMSVDRGGGPTLLVSDAFLLKIRGV
jgi:hypothetical protein